MILLAILSCFVLVVDRMYRNRVRKIVISMQIVRDFLIDEERVTREFEQTISTYMVIYKLMILLAIISRFALVVDSMYRNRVRKIVVSTQIVRDFLIDEERATHEFEQTLKNFCCLLIEKSNMVQIYEQIVSDIENKDTLQFFVLAAKF